MNNYQLHSVNPVRLFWLLDKCTWIIETHLFLSIPPGLPDLNKVVVIPYVLSKEETNLSKIPNRFVLIGFCCLSFKCHKTHVNKYVWYNFHLWYNTFLFFICSEFLDDFLASGRGEGDQFPQLEFEQLPFNHPLFIMYSSGTTGAPKCMVHSAGVRKKTLLFQCLTCRCLMLCDYLLFVPPNCCALKFMFLNVLEELDPAVPQTELSSLYSHLRLSSPGGKPLCAVGVSV